MTDSASCPVVQQVLDDLVAELVDDWRIFSVDAVSPDEVREALHVVIAEVMSVPDTAAAVSESDAESDPAPPLHRRVLNHLRRRIIAHPDRLPTLEFQRLLQAIEQVAERLEPRWSDRFQDRMTGPSGLDLIVEVAHDLRSPLTSILFLAETMMRGRSGALTPLQERQLGLVYSAAFGLNAVASDVIELVRGGDRLVGRQMQPFSVGEVLESVRDIVQPIAEEKGLTLQMEGPAEDMRLGYPGALNRVLLNLTTNALKFSAEGRVDVTARDVGGGVLEYRVRDTGRGIPTAAMATLFEPFRRRQQAGDYAFSGSGLGLSICRKLVEAMGATLDVETAPGQGTTFCFRLDAPLVGDSPLASQRT